jgi:medium-chain acyl-[acyl-carrier-protein] hydrolase
VFCFPQAGGGASVFHTWANGVAENIEIWSVQLPGRERRMFETPFTSIEPVVHAVKAGILPLLDKPFVFFGHSLGGWIAFELARSLRRSGAPMPVALLASGAGAPQVPRRNRQIHQLSDTDFLDALVELNGIPTAALENQELLDLVLPALRADFTIYETYSYSAEPPLDCRVSAFGGEGDPRVSIEELELWNQQTSGEFSVRAFPGDHFFIRSAWQLVLAAVNEEVDSAMRCGRNSQAI